MDMIVKRLSEPSTYAGAAAMLASLGVMGFNEGQWTTIFGAAAACCAAASMIMKEKGDG
jgi:type IV secretory pathway TrbL component